MFIDVITFDDLWKVPSLFSNSCGKNAQIFSNLMRHSRAQKVLSCGTTHSNSPQPFSQIWQRSDCFSICIQKFSPFLWTNPSPLPLWCYTLILSDHGRCCGTHNQMYVVSGLQTWSARQVNIFCQTLILFLRLDIQLTVKAFLYLNSKHELISWPDETDSCTLVVHPL